MTTFVNQVLRLKAEDWIAEGKSTKEIAFTLEISPKTIETHRRQIMQKLNLTNVAELTRFAICEGITSL